MTPAILPINRIVIGRYSMSGGSSIRNKSANGCHRKFDFGSLVKLRGSQWIHHAGGPYARILLRRD
ncbi:MAG TPA: hypothetical protein VMS31_14420, partial [Pyrinomonadaceae bacterium]|nr:hypothetical protein [Pyrinomonadaceae bacterium]